MNFSLIAFLIMIYSAVPIGLSAQSTTVPGTPQDTAEIAAVVAAHLEAQQGTIGFDTAIACLNGKACVEDPSTSKKATLGKKASFFKELRKNLKKSKFIPLAKAADCTDEVDSRCTLQVDRYYQVFVPKITTTSAFVGLQVSRISNGVTGGHMDTSTASVALEKVDGKWRIVKVFKNPWS